MCVGIDIAGECEGWLKCGGPAVADEVVGGSFVVFFASKGVVSVSVVCGATRAVGRVGCVVDWEAEFALESKAEAPIWEAVGWCVAAHGDEWV